MSDDGPVFPDQPPSRKLTGEVLRDIEEEHGEGTADPFEEAGDPYYEAFFCDQIIMFAEDMQFPEEWAAELGVTEAQMFGWISRFPEFARSYSLAITKLRAAFSREMREVARGNKPLAQATLYTLIAKKRFADLYGDPPPLAPPDAPNAGYNARDITPPDETVQGEVLEDPEDMADDALRAELDALRRRRETET